MGKHLKRIGLCAMAAAAVWMGAVLGDRQTLNEELIRLHVVANSDTEADQSVKLQVRDAVLASLRSGMEGIGDVEEAKRYLKANLPKIQTAAQGALEKAGVSRECVVTLCREAFETRQYDTFSLPAGVYESLRIVIGEGQGRNWWCVAFPQLCLPDSGAAFASAAVGAGFSEPLSKALTGEDCEIRFFLLDQLGRLENLLFAG